MRRTAAFAAGLGALAAGLWALAGTGLVNYDTLYSLVWGRELVEGRTPDLDLPLAPTPHPLGTLLGVLLSPLSLSSDAGVHGQGATGAALVLAFLALAALGWVTYALGSAWFGTWAGVLAAAIILTRRPVLDFGARAYIDIPYLVLVLGALLVETRRPRVGAPVLVLLAIAGLIRPEAWLFAGVYWLYLASTHRDVICARWRHTNDISTVASARERGRAGEYTASASQLAKLALLAATGPLLWALSDWIVTGDPLHSLTGTRDTARELGRITGLDDVPGTVPRRIGEILREPVLFGALGGLVFAWLALRDRARIAVAAAALGLAAFCVLAAAGLPILGRYLLLPATIGAILCGAGIFGWMALPRQHTLRRPWAWFGLTTIVLLVAFTPAQVDRIDALRSALARQAQIQDDLRALVRQPPGRLSPSCLPLGVPNHRPIPLLALWLDVPPGELPSLQRGTIARGSYVRPATAQVARDYVLDRRDLRKVVPPPPPGFTPAGGNESWLVFQRCNTGAG